MKTFTVATGLVLVLATAGALAQSQPGMGGNGGPGFGGSTVQAGSQNGQTLTADQFNKLQDYAEQSRRLTKEDKAAGKTLEQLLAEDKAAAAKMAAAMPLACNVDQAMLAAQGPATAADGTAIQTKTYEAACSNGMGYFLISQEPGKPYGISCFAADTARQVDVKAGKPPAPVCSLPPNANMLTVADTLMTRAGTACKPKDYRWLGQNAAAHVEYDEVKCSDDSGYIMAIALPGSTAEVRVASCHDSAMRGLPCRLSDNGKTLATLIPTFMDTLQQHQIACDAGSNDIQYHGQQSVQKRYVVEFKCSQHPAGLVALIPLDGVKAPFESMDCKAALKIKVFCKLNKPN